MPMSSTFLSFEPNARIAHDLSHSGVRSTKVCPTVSTGEAAGVVKAAARCPAARATAVVTRPMTPPTTHPREACAVGSSVRGPVFASALFAMHVSSDRLRRRRWADDSVSEQGIGGSCPASYLQEAWSTRSSYR
jgi:hypothetical protein